MQKRITRNEKPIDPDLQYIQSVLYSLTAWQRKKIYYRFCLSLAMERARRFSKFIAVKWIEITLHL